MSWQPRFNNFIKERDSDSQPNNEGPESQSPNKTNKKTSLEFKTPEAYRTAGDEEATTVQEWGVHNSQGQEEDNSKEEVGDSVVVQFC